MRIAGIVLDIYDDPRAEVLLTKISSTDQELPEKLASMRILSESELNELPDRLFAFVARNGEDTLRKFAMHDAEHLALSMIYFDESAKYLPEDARQKTAANLVNACAWYDLDPPESLVKEALAGALLGAATVGLGVKDMAGKAREGAQLGRERMEAFRQAQASGVKAASVKKADVVGTPAMPQSTLRSGSGVPSPSRRLDATQKTSGWQHCGDVTHAEVPVVKKVASYSHFALPHLRRYPIDTEEQLKQASAYFDEHFKAFPLPERRVYSQAVAERADELGVKLAGAFLKYAGDTYGPNIEAQLQTRARWFAGTGHEEVYQLLAEKTAEISPMVMAEMLQQADFETGADRAYDRLLDPYAAVYGSSKLSAKEKTDEDYSWADGTSYVSGLELKRLAARPLGLAEAFGKDFVKSFISDPIGIFKSMPVPQKVILSRLAADCA